MFISEKNVLEDKITIGAIEGFSIEIEYLNEKVSVANTAMESLEKLYDLEDSTEKSLSIESLSATLGVVSLEVEEKEKGGTLIMIVEAIKNVLNKIYEAIKNFFAAIGSWATAKFDKTKYFHDSVDKVLVSRGYLAGTLIFSRDMASITGGPSEAVALKPISLIDVVLSHSVKVNGHYATEKDIVMMSKYSDELLRLIKNNVVPPVAKIRADAIVELSVILQKYDSKENYEIDIQDLPEYKKLLKDTAKVMVKFNKDMADNDAFLGKIDDLKEITIDTNVVFKDTKADFGLMIKSAGVLFEKVLNLSTGSHVAKMFPKPYDNRARKIKNLNPKNVRKAGLALGSVIFDSMDKSSQNHNISSTTKKFIKACEPFYTTSYAYYGAAHKVAKSLPKIK